MADRGVNMSDLSGTITTGGTAQTLAVQNTGRRYLRISNPSSATESLWVNDKGGTATNAPPSFELQAGQAFEWVRPPTNAVSVYALTTGHAFEAAEG